MNLVIDIGNTNINFALINKHGKICHEDSIRTKELRAKRFLRPRRAPYEIDLRGQKIFIVSVVPWALKKIKRELKTNYRKSKIFVIGGNVKVPLRSLYNKKEIGQDRLVTAFAAKELYGLPILIVDFGTAVTFDAVSRKGAYLGGLILPGIKMSLEGLFERTAMLPKVYLNNTHSFIGKDTRSSIRGGMVYGYAAMCDGLIGLFKQKLGRELKVVATGGDAGLISRYTRSMRKVVPDLSLQGLRLLAETFTHLGSV